MCRQKKEESFSEKQENLRSNRETVTPMKFVVKIGLLALLLVLSCWEAKADSVSYADDNNASIVAYQECNASPRGRSYDNTQSFTTPMLMSHQQISIKLVPEDYRIRRAEELQQHFLKNLIGHFSLREGMQVLSHAKIFPSNPIHCVSPACHYFVFALRRILI